MGIGLGIGSDIFLGICLGIGFVVYLGIGLGICLGICLGLGFGVCLVLAWVCAWVYGRVPARGTPGEDDVMGRFK